MKNQEISVLVFDMEQYSGDWPSKSFPDAMEWFQSKMDAIPEEYRNSATLEIEGVGGYEGSAYANIKIQYMRMETDDEATLRESNQSRRREEIRESELRQLAQLKAKYKV